MGIVVRAGLILGGLVVLWTFFMGFAGWATDPVLLNLFWVVIAIQAAVLIWALRHSARSRGYAGQLATGLGVSLVAGVVVFLGSLLYTGVVFPRYFEELRAMAEQLYARQGKSPDEIRALIARDMALQTPLVQAFFGLLGTAITGLVVSAIAAIFLRQKDRPAAAAARVS